MFTGLIETTGKVLGQDKMGGQVRLTLSTNGVFSDLCTGESIAVNGVCLTVEGHSADSFSAYASAETISHTNLGKLVRGDVVNLERALAMGDRLGGHIVTGHVDCMGVVQSRQRAGESEIIRIGFDEKISPYVIGKGSVSLNGISLTINNCSFKFLEVNIIPETMQRTNINLWKTGYFLNIETDIIGKYVNRLVSPYAPGAAKSSPSGKITEEFLARHGF